MHRRSEARLDPRFNEHEHVLSAYTVMAHFRRDSAPSNDWEQQAGGLLLLQLSLSTALSEPEQQDSTYGSS